MQTDKFRPRGGWLDKLDDPQPTLEGHANADAIVVGAGFAGLSTALELAARGAKVVVIERDCAGAGASGRNAGYLAGGQALEYDMFVKRVGMEQARKIVRFYDDGVEYVEGKLAEFGIDCDYNPTGVIRTGVHPSQEKRLRESMEMGIALGSPAQYLDCAEMRTRRIPPAFLFGCLMPRGGTLDPGKYVMGLRRAALAAGVRLYENTPLISHEEGATVKAHTPAGSVTAPFLVFATNAYTPQLGLLRDKVMSLRVSAIETEPLTGAQLEQLGWPQREGIITAHWTMESHRLTPRNSLVVTTKRLGYAFGSRTPNVPDDTAYGALEAALRQRFPMLGNLGIRSCWSGYVTMAYDALPVVGEAGAPGNILFTAGCAGHGVGTQSLMGRLIADRIRGVEHPHLQALRHATPSTLPEPLQWCAVRGTLGLLNMLDDRVNRKVLGARG